MRGHEPIIRMRMAGRTPRIVFLNDYPSPEAKDWHQPGERYGQQWEPDHATVCTHGDAISGLDLRFLKGLTVSISADSEARAKALFAKAKWFGASTVAACHSTIDSRGHVDAGWTEIFHEQEKEFEHAGVH